MRSNHKEPMFNVEDQAPVWLAAILVLTYAGFAFAPDGFKDFLFNAGALGARDGNVFLDGRPLGNFATLLTHTLLHADWGHVLFNAGMILAMGTITIRGVKSRHTPLIGFLARGSAVFWGIFLAGAILGGLLQWLLWIVLGASGAALGASTGGAALFASAGWAWGGRQRLFLFFIVMVAFDAVNVYLGSLGASTSNPAWAGHLGGFIAGAALAPLWVKPESALGFMRR